VQCYEYFTLGGLNKEQIGCKMGISYDTVEAYISSSYQSSDAAFLRDKLGLTTRS